MDQFFEKYKKVKGIFVTNSRSHLVANYLNENQINSIVFAGYDLISENMIYLEKGTIDFLIGQRPKEQGYKAIMAVFSFLVLKQEVEKVNYSPIDIITKENAKYYWDFDSN